MSDLGNKIIFSKNLKYYLDKSGKDRKEICNALGFKYSTFCEWVSAKKYPRIDKIELLANYFGILKSDLIEDKGKKTDAETQLSYDDITIQYATMFSKLSSSGKEKVIDYTTLVYNSEKTTE